MMIKPLNILGLMNGTALDGTKASLISTDGVDIYEILHTQYFAFPDDLRNMLRTLTRDNTAREKTQPAWAEVDSDFNGFSLKIIEFFKDTYDNKIDLIGFEGPLICQMTKQKPVCQLGNGAYLADKSGIRVVGRFHDADILNNGQGAPLTATYFNALAQNMAKPVVFINISGTTSLTWIGHYGEIIAFDCGPGNALIDDWMIKHAGLQMDYNGKVAATGKIDYKIISQMMKHRFFATHPPKTLGRDNFNEKAEHLEGLSLADGAATAAAFIGEAIAYAMVLYLPELPVHAYICGGGASNPTLVRLVRQKLKELDVAVFLEEDGDLQINDAHAVAFIAARRIYNLPITFPSTTGVDQPLCGGEIYEAKGDG